MIVHVCLEATLEKEMTLLRSINCSIKTEFEILQLFNHICNLCFADEISLETLTCALEKDGEVRILIFDIVFIAFVSLIHS